MTKTEKYILPSYYASYLIDGDHSSLEDAEIEKINKWIKKEGLGWCLNVSEDSYFAYRSDLDSMGGDVSEFTFEVKE